MTGVQPDGFNLPSQHTHSHYRHLIEEFGAPGGICSSITESHHITAIKKPWQRSNRYEALHQMLVTNQCLNKLIAAHIDFINQGMLPPSYAPPPMPVEHVHDNDEGGDDAEPTDNPYVMGNVILARTRVGNVTGYPGVFQSNPHPFPSKPIPASMGTGFHGHGSRVYKNPWVSQPV